MNYSNLSTARASCFRGFTIVELMVTIAIAAILLAVAAPNYTTFIRNSQLSDAVGEFMAAVNAARGNAIKQGINTYLVPTTGTDWSTGWYVFADGNWDGVYTANDTRDVLIMQSPAPSSILTVATSAGNNSTLTDGYLLFTGSGYPKQKNGGMATGKINVINGSIRTTIINIDNTGRVRSCIKNTTTCTN